MSHHARDLIREIYAGHLVPGERYRVTKTFLDAAQTVHPAGEVWTFEGYLPNGFAGATYIQTSDGAFAVAWSDDPTNFCNAPQAYLQLLKHEA
jgi:hypothetical protein